MASYNLYLRFNNELHEFSLNTDMSFNCIKDTVGRPLHISPNTFDIQIYDKDDKDMFVLHDDYVTLIHEGLPRTYVDTLYGDILMHDSLLGKSKYVDLHLGIIPDSTVLKGILKR